MSGTTKLLIGARCTVLCAAAQIGFAIVVWPPFQGVYKGERKYKDESMLVFEEDDGTEYHILESHLQMIQPM